MEKVNMNNDLEGISKREILKRLERSTSETIQYLNRINKAIEYIVENMSYIANGKKDYIPAGEDLLDILKGSEE